MKNPVQNIPLLLSRTPGLWCIAVVAILRAICSCDFVSSGNVVRRAACSPRRGSFHEPKGPAPFHSIESVDNLVSIENGYQPVHRARSVALAECNVFPKDAPGVLDGRQYDVLIRGVHGARLSADSIRSVSVRSYGGAGSG